MKKLFTLFISLTICTLGFSQTDTISENIYQKNGYLGIGINSPNFLLQIEGNEGSGIERNFIKLHNNINSSLAYTGIILQTGSDQGMSVIQDYSTLYTASSAYDFAGFLNIGNSNNGIMFNAREQGIIKFYTGHDPIAGGGVERLRIDSAGNIGIGTKEPIAKLQIADGDIYLSDIEKGIIMKSSNGNCWRGVVDNSGQLIFTSIDCPETGVVNKTQKLKSSENVLIFPNPTKDNITINLEINQIEEPKYTICNINGQLEDNGKIKSNNQIIDISTLTNGIHILNIYDKKGNKLATEKIIKE